MVLKAANNCMTVASEEVAEPRGNGYEHIIMSVITQIIKWPSSHIHTPGYGLGGLSQESALL